MTFFDSLLQVLIIIQHFMEVPNRGLDTMCNGPEGQVVMRACKGPIQCHISLYGREKWVARGEPRVVFQELLFPLPSSELNADAYVGPSFVKPFGFH